MYNLTISPIKCYQLFKIKSSTRLQHYPSANQINLICKVQNVFKQKLSNYPNEFFSYFKIKRIKTDGLMPANLQRSLVAIVASSILHCIIGLEAYLNLNGEMLSVDLCQ